METARFLNAGEQGLVVEFGNRIDPALTRQVRLLAEHLKAAGPPGVRECVPTYRSLTIYFDPLRLPRRDLIDRVRELLDRQGDSAAVQVPSRLIRIPVCYGGDFGPDLDFVAEYSGLPAAEVISLHSGRPYLVYMLGFLPGFPYLGGLPEVLAAPRLETPRVKIPAGSVGIAGGQTGIYPLESPGGWRLIGRTPLTIFRAGSDQAPLFSAGDYLEFYPVSRDEFEGIKKEDAEGRYAPRIRPFQGGEA